MSDEEINRAIAEHLGWRCQSHVPEQNKAGATMCWIPPGNHEWHPVQIPNYCGDLNAMHEAEKALTKKDLWEMTMQLCNIVYGDVPLAHATAPQRAEAFLRTVGKWRGEE
jgi:hypothetical protein